MALAIVEMCWDTGTNIYILYTNIVTGLRPNVHSNFSRVGQFPNFLVPQAIINDFIFQWWIIPISCLFFFAFFGFSEEAVSDYRVAFFWICRNMFRYDFSKPKHRLVLPIYTEEPKCAMEVCRSHASLQATQKPWDCMSLSLTDFGDGAASIAPSYCEISPTTADSFAKSKERFIVDPTHHSSCVESESSDALHGPPTTEKNTCSIT